MLEGLGAGSTASFPSKICPKLSRYLIREIIQALNELSIVVILAFFVTLGEEKFQKVPDVLISDWMI